MVDPIDGTADQKQAVPADEASEPSGSANACYYRRNYRGGVALLILGGFCWLMALAALGGGLARWRRDVQTLAGLALGVLAVWLIHQAATLTVLRSCG